MKLLMKILTVMLVSVMYWYLVFCFGNTLLSVKAGALLCVLIMICTFVILGRIKALESKIEALAGERNKPETGEIESEGNS